MGDSLYVSLAALIAATWLLVLIAQLLRTIRRYYEAKRFATLIGLCLHPDRIEALKQEGWDLRP